MKYFKTKKKVISGSNFSEVRGEADIIFRKIKSRSKRTPYLRSKYFKNDKVFLNIFWQHLFEKRERDRMRRLKFMGCALDLIRNSTGEPTIKTNPNNKSELLYRFYGITDDNRKFGVQIKENLKSKKKNLISIFPWEKQK